MLHEITFQTERKIGAQEVSLLFFVLILIAWWVRSTNSGHPSSQNEWQVWPNWCYYDKEGKEKEKITMTSGLSVWGLMALFTYTFQWKGPMGQPTCWHFWQMGQWRWEHSFIWVDVWQWCSEKKKCYATMICHKNKNELTAPQISQQVQ